MITNRIKALALCAAIGIVSTAEAAITYVDITDGPAGNTTTFTNGQWQPWTAFNGQTALANDGIWDRRAFGNLATIFQNAANALADTNAARLKTSIAVPEPPPGQYYNVYGLFWTDTSPTWTAGAALTDYPGPLPFYRQGSPGVRRLWASTTDSTTIYSTNLSPNPFTTPVMISEGNRRLLMTPVLGRVYDTNITVFLGPDPNQTGSDTRTWLDGIGYELIANQLLLPLLLPNGDVSVTYSGTSGRSYSWERTDSLEPPVAWIAMQTSTANTLGLVSLTNTPSDSQQFYRIHDVTPPPVTVSNLTATAGVGQVALSWPGSPLAHSYNVKRSTASGGPYMTLTNRTITSFIDTNVVNGTSYYYVVSALNFDGESADSVERSATPFPPQPPVVPANLVATPGESLVWLTWSTASGATNYLVKAAATSGGPYTTVTNIAGTSFVHTGLTNGTTYYFTVSGVNVYGESGNALEASATPAELPPFSPTGLTAVASNAQVSLTWTAAVGGTNYTVKRATINGGPYTAITNVTTTSFVDFDVTNAMPYYYVIAAFNNFGESPNSAQVTATPFDTPPLVYSVEFTGTNFPAPPLPTLANLPIIQPLPDPFAWASDPLNMVGTRSTSFYDWSHRRAEIKAQVENYEIGPKPSVDRTNVFASYNAITATNGTLTVRITNMVAGLPRTLTLTCAVLLPAGDGPFPAVIGMNTPSGSIPANLFTSRDIARITFSHNQVTTYSNPQNTNPYYQLYPNLNIDNSGQYSAWAWGVSRIIDGLEMVQDALPINIRAIAVTGCSYAGKMALFSGAFDERIALTIAQESGGGGANSWRYNETEPAGTVEKISNTDHNWFSEGMFAFSGANVSRLPIDHHMLMAMVAPRALFVTGNPDFTWLGNPSHYVASRAVEKIYNTWGIGDRFGFNNIGGHGHCATTPSIDAEVGAFLDKFLLGNTNVNTVIRTYINPYNSIDHARWSHWWGTTNAAFGP
ncbi:MAG TPA: hypothetical protein VEH04_19005 [Verrucomicrobiae bacterium]|nr:hypothetical protein [Verrucomicrobiae bacterium]